MDKSRLEAFSDGVFAVIITIMVLDLKAPAGDNLNALKPLLPIFLSYVLSFVYVAIYWNNHHHLFQIVKNVRGGVLWANVHLLFWLSLFPFVTAWAGENHFTSWPTAVYGFVLLMAAIAYFLLPRRLLAAHGRHSALSHALGSDFKGKISPVFYALAIPLASVSPHFAVLIYAGVALLWIVPDRRVEHVIEREGHK